MNDTRTGDFDPRQPHAYAVCSVNANYSGRLRFAWLVVCYLARVLNPWHTGAYMSIGSHIEEEIGL